jgi:hypothetical protein
VRETKDAADTAHSGATSTDVDNSAIMPITGGLNASNGPYAATWNSTNSPTSDHPDATPPGKPIQNTVGTTVTHKWAHGLNITGSVDLTSKFAMSMS